MWQLIGNCKACSHIQLNIQWKQVVAWNISYPFSAIKMMKSEEIHLFLQLQNHLIYTIYYSHLSHY